MYNIGTLVSNVPLHYRSYRLYKAWPLTYLLYIAIVVDLSLVLFEEPAVPSLALHYSVKCVNMFYTYIFFFFIFFFIIFIVFIFCIFIVLSMASCSSCSSASSSLSSSSASFPLSPFSSISSFSFVTLIFYLPQRLHDILKKVSVKGYAFLQLFLEH